MSPIASSYADQLRIPNPFNPELRVADDPTRVPKIRPAFYRKDRPRSPYRRVEQQN